MEVGAEDVVNNEDSFEIITKPSDYLTVDKALRKAGYELVESEISYVPSVESTPDENDLKNLKKLVDVLEDNEFFLLRLYIVIVFFYAGSKFIVTFIYSLDHINVVQKIKYARV